MTDEPSDLGFSYKVLKSGDVEILHPRCVVATPLILSSRLSAERPTRHKY